MFENYDNKNFHLDFWESCESGTITVKTSSQWNISKSIKETLSILNTNTIFNESFEYEGKVYDNLENVFHVGSYVESIKNIRQLANLLNPVNLHKAYPRDDQYPVDFFVQFINPSDLKRLAIMIVYETNPFEDNKYDKKTGRIIVYKAKAFAARRYKTTWRFEYIINNKNDIAKARDDKDLRITWAFEPRKTIYELSPSAIQKNVSAVISKLTTYKVVDDDLAEVTREIIDAAR